MSITVLEEVVEGIIRGLEDDDGAVEAFLFGSMSRGDYHLESDIDVLVVSRKMDKTRRRMQEIGAALSLEYGVVVSVIVVDEDSWRRGLSLLRDTVRREGKLIWTRKRR